MMLKLTMFSDFICPFCYVAYATVGLLQDEGNEIDLQWRGFQIHPEWPAAGIEAAELYGDGRNGLWTRVQQLAASIGLEIRPPARLYNSRLALEAAEAANAMGADRTFKRRVYRAYFGENADLADRNVLAGLATDVGIDRDAFLSELDSTRHALRIKNNAMIANQRGVSGVPTLFFGNYPLAGAQTLDTMRAIVRRAAAIQPA